MEYEVISSSFGEETIFTIIPGWLLALITILSIIGIWKVFTKADVPGWLSIIPIVNLVYIVKIVWGKPIYALWILVPIANIVFAIMTNYKLGEAFNTSTGFKIGLVLLPTLFMMILGFGNYEYVGPGGRSDFYQAPGSEANYRIVENEEKK